MQKNQLGNGKLLVGALGGPLVVYLLWSNNLGVGCAGLFALVTVVCWVLIYLRAKAMVRSVSLPRRSSNPDIAALPTQPLPPRAATPSSENLFL